MTAGAHFTINQAANIVPTGTVDIARIDIYQNQTVHFVGDNTSGQVSPLWTILSWADAAARTQPTSATSFDATYTFATPGSYKMELVVNDGIGANLKRFVVRVTRTSGGLIYDDGVAEPAFGEEVGDDNSASNDRGYAKVFELGLSRQLPAIDNAAALIARAGNRHKHVRLLGYHAVGDGGGGELYWDAASTATHDGGRVFQPGYNTAGVLATGRWIRPIEGEIDVRKWGAKGDGIANDGPAIQAALDYAFTLYTTSKTGVPMQNSRFQGPVVRLPRGRYAVGLLSGLHATVLTTFQHCIEIFAVQALRGERGTSIFPHSSIWTAFTANAGTDTVTAAALSVANGDKVRVIQYQASVLPGGLSAATDYYVGNYSAGTFKLYIDVGLTTLVDITDAGTGTFEIFRPCALIRSWCYDNQFENLQFVNGSHAIALCGNVRDLYGTYWNPGLGPEHLNVFENCEFNEQASVSVWLDHTPISHPGPSASSPFQPRLEFRGCKGFGPAFIWGTFDGLIVNTMTWGWIQNFFVPDESVDGFPLGLFNVNGNCFINNLLVETYNKPVRACMLCISGGGVMLSGETQFDQSTTVARFRKHADTAYQGPIGEAPVELSLGAIAGSLKIDGNTNITSLNIPWCEIYDRMPRMLDVHVFPLNLTSSGGIYVNDSVDLEVTAQTHAIDQVIRFAGMQSSSFNRFRYGNETFRASGGLDITNVLRPFMVDISEESKASSVGRTNNLFTADQTDVSDLNLGGSSFGVTGSITTDDGYPLDVYTASALATFSFQSDDWGHGLAPGLYTISYEIRPSFSGSMNAATVLNGTRSNAIAVRFDGTNTWQRISHTFHLPVLGGGDTFTVGGQFDNPLPETGHTWSIGKFQIVPGERPAAYTRPVDDPATPTEQLTGLEPTTYYVDALPTTGTYNTGDLLLKNAPGPGEVWGWRCTTGGTDASLAFQELGRLTGETLTGFLDFDHGAASVTAGQSVTIEADVTGAERGDEVSAYPTQHPGDGWLLTASIDNLDKVKITTTNATGTNNPIPADPFGVNLVVKKHPFFADFPSPYAFLIADHGVGLVGGAVNTWASQVPGGHDAGPQGTAGKRPSVVSAAPALGGRDSLAGTRAANTALPVTWAFGNKNTIVQVIKANTTANSYYWSNVTAGTGLIHKFVGDTLEWLNGADRYTIANIGTTGYHIIIITQNDAGNVIAYYNGVQVFSHAATVALDPNTISVLFDAGLGGGSVTGEIPAMALFTDEFTAVQARVMYLKLKGYYKL